VCCINVHLQLQLQFKSGCFLGPQDGCLSPGDVIGYKTPIIGKAECGWPRAMIAAMSTVAVNIHKASKYTG